MKLLLEKSIDLKAGVLEEYIVVFRIFVNVCSKFDHEIIKDVNYLNKVKK